MRPWAQWCINHNLRWVVYFVTALSCFAISMACIVMAIIEGFSWFRIELRNNYCELRFYANESWKSIKAQEKTK